MQNELMTRERLRQNLKLKTKACIHGNVTFPSHLTVSNVTVI